MRRTIATIFMIMLAIIFAVTIFPPNAKAVDVEIISITPISQQGKAGETINIIGTLNTTNGLYQIWFDQQKIIETNASENVVNATFPVPNLPGGNYTITLQDYSFDANVTTWFYIETAYYIEAKTPSSPEQLQEGSTVEIWANVTGGEPNMVYYANITVKAPTNTTYWSLVPLANTTDTGEGQNTTIVFPTHFNGAAQTNYTGTYTVAFNKTLAATTFFIGLTNSTEYHRYQLVDIKAVGYKPNENATIKMSFGGKTINSTSATASLEGLITTNWAVPSNASIGTYTVNVTSISPNATIKKPPDVQNFTVPGFDVNVTAKSLAGETAPSVTIRVFENGKSVVNSTSDSSGLLQIKLEIGNYSSKAFYKEEEVGELWINVAEAVSLDFYCNLTNLKISVFAKLDGAEIPVPEVEIHLTPENRMLYTNTTGTAVANLLLPNHTYALNLSRYGVSFNATSFPTLHVNGNVVAWYNVTFICPTLTLQVNMTAANSEPISNVKVTAQELMGGLYYVGTTPEDGTVIFNCAFGKYQIEAFDSDGIQLNETTVSLFQNRNVSIVCKLYGLTVSFRIVDFFGQPISNVNVTLQRGNLVHGSNRTQANGLAIFNRVTGGSFQVSVYIFNQIQPDEAKAIYVEDSTTIEIKLEEYVVLAGLIINTAILATTIIIVVALVLVLLIEVYRRKSRKTLKSAKTEQK